MTESSPGAPATSREEAQQRADRIGAFREELAAVEGEGVLLLTKEQRVALERHHTALLEQLARAFDVDRTARQKRLSAGMKVATLLGALALAAALYTFLYRFSDNAWLWYEPESDNPRWMLNLTTGQWEQR